MEPQLLEEFYEVRVTYVPKSHALVALTGGVHARAALHLAALVRGRIGGLLTLFHDDRDRHFTVISEEAFEPLDAALRAAAAELRVALEVTRARLDAAPIGAALAAAARAHLRRHLAASAGFSNVGALAAQYIRSAEPTSAPLSSTTARTLKLDVIDVVVTTRDVVAPDGTIGRDFAVCFAVGPPATATAVPMMRYARDDAEAYDDDIAAAQHQHFGAEDAAAAAAVERPVLRLPRLRASLIVGLAATAAGLETRGDAVSRARGFGGDIPRTTLEQRALWRATTDLAWLDELAERVANPGFVALSDVGSGCQLTVPLVYAWRSFVRHARAPKPARGARTAASATEALATFTLPLHQRRVPTVRVAPTSGAAGAPRGTPAFRSAGSGAARKARAPVWQQRRTPASATPASAAPLSHRVPLPSAASAPKTATRSLPAFSKRRVVASCSTAAARAPAKQTRFASMSSSANTSVAPPPPMPPAKKKRKASKKMTPEESSVAVSRVVALVRSGKDGALNGCKSAELKAYLKAHGLTVGGKKVDLISRVLAHQYTRAPQPAPANRNA
jgi:hypothetical protein